MFLFTDEAFHPRGSNPTYTEPLAIKMHALGSNVINVLDINTR